MARDVQLVADFIAAVPGFEDIYTSHLDDNEVVLPHVIFWDITQEIVASFLREDSDPPTWRDALEFLEERFTLNVPEMNKVIVTSFLGLLPYPGQPGYDIINRLGPTLKRRFDLIRPRG
jgi:hypothetical protein